MKKKISKKILAPAALALVLASAVSIPQAMAYFTTYASAEGGMAVTLGSEVTIEEEEVVGFVKRIVLTNTGDQECYVRARIYCGTDKEMQLQDETGKWSLDAEESNPEQGEYVYVYSDIVPSGGQTETLAAKIVLPEGYDSDFDVIVVEECTPVTYGADGEPEAPDWNLAADTARGGEA